MNKVVVEKKTFKEMFPTFTEWNDKVLSLVNTMVPAGAPFLDDSEMYYSKNTIYTAILNKYETMYGVDEEDRTVKLLANALIQNLPALYVKSNKLKATFLATISNESILELITEWKNDDPDNKYRSNETAYTSSPSSANNLPFNMEKIKEKSINYIKDATVRQKIVKDIIDRFNKLEFVKLNGYLGDFINTIEISSLFEIVDLLDTEYKIEVGGNSKFKSGENVSTVSLIGLTEDPVVALYSKEYIDNIAGFDDTLIERLDALEIRVDNIEAEQITQNTNIQNNTNDISNIKAEQITQNTDIQSNTTDVTNIKAEQIVQNTNIQSNTDSITNLNAEQIVQDTNIQNNITSIDNINTEQTVQNLAIQENADNIETIIQNIGVISVPFDPQLPCVTSGSDLICTFNGTEDFSSWQTDDKVIIKITDTSTTLSDYLNESWLNGTGTNNTFFSDSDVEVFTFSDRIEIKNVIGGEQNNKVAINIRNTSLGIEIDLSNYVKKPTDYTSLNTTNELFNENVPIGDHVILFDQELNKNLIYQRKDDFSGQQLFQSVNFADEEDFDIRHINVFPFATPIKSIASKINIADGTEPQHGVTKKQLDDAVAAAKQEVRDELGEKVLYDYLSDSSTIGAIEWTGAEEKEFVIPDLDKYERVKIQFTTGSFFFYSEAYPFHEIALGRQIIIGNTQNLRYFSFGDITGPSSGSWQTYHVNIFINDYSLKTNSSYLRRASTSSSPNSVENKVYISKIIGVKKKTT